MYVLNQGGHMDMGSVAKFLDRLKKESISKIASLVLADRDFLDDVRSAESLSDYLSMISEKPKKNASEWVFFALPTEDQNRIWATVRGVTNATSK